MRTRPPGRPGTGDSGRNSNRPSGPRRDRRERRPDRPPHSARPRSSAGDLLYGRNAVAEAIEGRRSIKRLLVAEGIREDARLRSLLERAQRRGLTIDRMPRLLLDDLTEGANHQGVALEAGQYPYVDLDAVIERRGTVLVLDHLQDPQNFGTLLRAVDAAGAGGVVIARDRAVGVTPAVVNTSAGAAEHLLVAQETNISRALDRLIEAGWWAVGLDTGEDAVDLFTSEVPTPVALVVGSEGSGLTALARKRCQIIVSLPMRGRIASLNAATAAAIALFELLRRETS